MTLPGRWPERFNFIAQSAQRNFQESGEMSQRSDFNFIVRLGRKIPFLGRPWRFDFYVRQFYAQCEASSVIVAEKFRQKIALPNLCLDGKREQLQSLAGFGQRLGFD